MSDETRLVEQAKRIRARWNGVQRLENNTLSGQEMGRPYAGLNTYSGSSVTNTTADFLGDWRAADSWMRFDLYRVRNRSRQLARGNNMVRNFLRSLCHYVLGAHGFHLKINALTMSSLGDNTDGKPDDNANTEAKRVMREMGKPANFDSRKRLSRRAMDELIVWKLPIDGEVIMRKRRGYDNEFRFAWQMIDPDYLDFNLNRVESGYDSDGRKVAEPGNLTKMGVELDKTEKFVVAYWFLQRRPNDYLYNYQTIANQRYYRVPAEEIIHIFQQTEDSEQTRGWPWIFAGMVNLNRADKFSEAALVNAQIGAAKSIFYTKQYPEGFEGDPFDVPGDPGYMIDKVQNGMGVELPLGVDAKVLDMRFPDGEMGPFMQAMSLGMALTFGTSYATTTGDLSQANFVSSKLGIEAENSLYHATQELLIEQWKVPGYEEEMYRAMLARKTFLPISKYDKFSLPIFTGHRRSGIQPLEEAKADSENLNNRKTSISALIEKAGENRDEVFAQIAKDEADLEALKIARITGVPPTAEVDGEETDPTATPKKKPAAPAKKN